MAGVALGLAALLVVGTVVMLVLAVRRRPGPIVGPDADRRAVSADHGGVPTDDDRRAGTATPTDRRAEAGRPSTVDRLAVGAEVQYDEREWVVIGAQRFAAADDRPAWTAWHLDQKGQPGWMATVDGDDHLLFAVGAERPEAIDPDRDPLT